MKMAPLLKFYLYFWLCWSDWGLCSRILRWYKSSLLSSPLGELGLLGFLKLKACCGLEFELCPIIFSMFWKYFIWRQRGLWRWRLWTLPLAVGLGLRWWVLFRFGRGKEAFCCCGGHTIACLTTRWRYLIMFYLIPPRVLSREGLPWWGY